ncbi:hypothetical protein [Gemmiger formicilis]
MDLSSHYTSHAKDGTERKISVYRCEDCSGCPCAPYSPDG